MHLRVLLRAALWTWIGVALLLTACGESAPENPNVGQDISAAFNEADDRLLLWLGEGPAPDRKSSGSTGQIVYLNRDRSVQTVMDVPVGVTGVYPCGSSATSPDGRYFTFFVAAPSAGVDGGTLYQVTGSGEPQSIGETHALTCIGQALQYAPPREEDASHWLGYINYTDIGSEFARGSLRLLNPASPDAPLHSAENVAGFHLTSGEALYVSLFTNTNNQADEAGVFVWDGSSEREIATLFPAENCRFTSGQVAPASATQLAVVMGQRCPGTDSQWQFYVVDRENGAYTLALSERQPNSFFPYTRTNNVIGTGQDGIVLFTPTDGLTANTVGLMAVDVNDVTSETELIRRGAVMARTSATPNTFTIPDNAPLTYSPDGRWLALTINAPGESPAVAAVDLNAPDLPPIRVPAGSSGESIPMLHFTADSSRLIYLAGGAGGRENSLQSLNLSTEANERIVRGQFGPGVVSPGGDLFALLAYRETEEARPRSYVDLVSVNLTGEVTTLYNGAVREENGDYSGLQFAYPLAWR